MKRLIITGKRMHLEESKYFPVTAFQIQIITAKELRAIF